MKFTLWIALMFSVVAMTASAAGPAEVRKQVEASTVVTGTVDIEPDGSVSAHAVDKAGELSEGIVALLDEAIPQWRFAPIEVDGKAVPARAKMSVRLVAKKKDDGDYQLGIRSASFGEDNSTPGAAVVRKTMKPPRFPTRALQSAVSGTVFLVLRIDQRGHVADAVAERVNLRVVGSEQRMQRGRDLLAEASLAAARRWTFTVPKAGPQADREFWSIRVPVDYTFGRQEKPKYGGWEAYVPGPYQRPPWISPEEAADFGGSDALIAGSVQPVGSGPKLLTPLGADAG